MFPRHRVFLERKLRLTGANTLGKKEAICVECVCTARALSGFVGVLVATGLRVEIVIAITARGFWTSLITIFVILTVVVEGLRPFTRTRGQWRRRPNGRQLHRLGA